MNYHYEKFVKYSLLQCRVSDYGNSERVKRHNEASQKLIELEERIEKNGEVCILLELLQHADARVCLNAASCCIDLKVYPAEVKEGLERLLSKEEDKSFRLSAEMLLKKLEAADN